ncbi:MAG TPA: DUF1294 domain-containing protein [Hyphomonas sp.]|nr:DUF1294 domain-containing protein [Hyphomonas sp.]
MDLEQLAEDISPPVAVLLFLVLINATAFLLFGLDKWCAIRNMRRIPERMLLFLSMIGGSLGGVIAMFVFRHKTRKTSFRMAMLTIVLLQMAGLTWLAFDPQSLLNLSA